MKIEGKKILITGASSGIGLALAKQLATKGGVITLVSRNEERLKNALEEIKTASLQITTPMIMVCDVTDNNSVSKVIEELSGDIDILINNAGMGIYGAIERTIIDDFRSVMEVNFFGAVNFTLQILPYLKEKGKGLIVNIASVAAMYGVPYLSTYSASKSALVAFSQSIQAELQKYHISIMIVYPGYTQTNFFVNEKMVGGARLPSYQYASPEKVSKAIVKAIEDDKTELVLTIEGKILKIAKGLMSGLVDWVMEKIACRLKD